VADPTAPAEPPASDADERVPVEVDARGLACPMPVIELSRAIEAGAVGTVVRLLATDPAAKVDVPVWCRMQRQQLRRASAADDGSWEFLVEKVR
jgi:tRNA 2-thiouridine synthesizing protein A